MPEQPGRSLAVPEDGAVEEAVFDGEVVEEEPPKPPAVVVLRPVVQVFQTITVVVQHDATRTAAKHAAYVPAGAVALFRRRQQGRTLAERMAQQLALQGETDKAALLLKNAQDERHRRHERSQARIGTFVVLVKNAHWITLATAGGMLGVGIAVGNPAWAFTTTEAAIRDSVTALKIACLAAPFALTAGLYRIGKREQAWAPGWARTSADADIDVTIDELTITNALANLRIPQIRDYLKQGSPLQFIVPCRQEGRGTYFEVRLPGVPAEKVIRRRTDFAAGVHRLPKEVWPSMGGEAAILKGWIADKGALSEGAGEYPLLAEGFADVFKGLPFGRTLKGDPAKIPVIGRNSIDGGMPEQGKSNGARVVACGYTLDLVTEVRIYVPDTNFDFEGFKPRCSRYLMGAEDEVIERMLEEQELLKEELQARGQLLVDHGVQEVTREIAHAGVGLHPVFVLLEEAHVCIQHKKYGKDFAQLLGENVKLDRKRGVHIKVSTQAPVRGSMPRDVTTNCTVGIAYALADVYANDAILGPGAHSSGHRATELIPGQDRGIALCKGFAGEARSEMIQAYRVNSAQVPPIVQRAMTALAEQGLPVPGTGQPLAVVERDLLADVAAVIDGPWRVNVNDLPDRLRRLAPSWGRYRGLTGKQLRAWLKDEEVRTANTDNRPTLDPADLHAVIVLRERDE